MSIFVHDELEHRYIREKYINGNNYLWIHVKKLNLDIGIIYKPGDTNTNEFINDLEEELNKKKELCLVILI